MARRPFPDEPVSRVAVWSSRLALFAIAVAALSVIIVRSGLLEIVPALATFAAALVFAGLAISACLCGLRRHLAAGNAGVSAGHCSACFSAWRCSPTQPISAPAPCDLPAISDVTTDTANPPRFDVLARLRPRERTDYPGPAVAALQRTAYPDVVPLDLDCPNQGRL